MPVSSHRVIFAADRSSRRPLLELSCPTMESGGLVGEAFGQLFLSGWNLFSLTLKNYWKEQKIPNLINSTFTVTTKLLVVYTQCLRKGFYYFVAKTPNKPCLNFLLMFLFERLKNPNNKTPNIKKKKQKSYRWEMVWICHSTVAPVCTQASCRQRSGRDQHGTQRPNAVQETANPRIRNKGHKTPTTPHLSPTSNEKHRQTNVLGSSRVTDGNCT